MAKKPVLGQTRINAAVTALQKGEVIVFPTETVYGLGCDPRNSKAIQRIYNLKQRPANKSLILVAASWTQIQKIAEISKSQVAFLKQYWPDALTILLKPRANHGLDANLIQNGKIAIRLTSSEVAAEISRKFGFPIIATSANLSDQPECRSGRAVRRIFNNQLDFIYDAGSLPKRRASTLAELLPDGTIQILRPGPIKLPKSWR